MTAELDLLRAMIRPLLPRPARFREPWRGDGHDAARLDRAEAKRERRRRRNLAQVGK